MKKKGKVSIFLLGCLFAAQLTVSLASAQETKVVLWDEFAPEEIHFVEDTYRPIMRASVMYSGYIRLGDEDGKAGVYGETLAIRNSDIVGLDLFLDKYDGKGYGTYTYWETVENNTSTNIKSYTVSVPKGYYYRLHGYHYVQDGSDFENGSTLTQGLKIPQY